MKYLKVKNEFNNKQVNNDCKLIANELYTFKEAEKLGVKKEYCNEVEISRKKIGILLGTRFLKAEVSQICGTKLGSYVYKRWKKKKT